MTLLISKRNHFLFGKFLSLNNIVQPFAFGLSLYIITNDDKKISLYIYVIPIYFEMCVKMSSSNIMYILLIPGNLIQTQVSCWE